VSGASYIHGTSDSEQARLALMNGLLNDRAIARLGLRGDEREMGAGTGLFAAALARAVPQGSVLAIERDERQLAAARRNAAGIERLEVRAGDACAPPLAAGERGAFDLVHARFLLEHLDRPLDAVRAMVGAARPGGRIVLMDDDHSLMRFHPDLPELDALWELYWRQYERIGNDPLVGRRLVTLLVEAGARPVATDLLHYGACRDEAAFDGVVTNLIGVIESAREALLASGATTAAAIDATLATTRSWAHRPDATVWYALPWAEGTPRNANGV